MGKYKITGILSNNPEKTNALFDKYDIWHETKSNGSIWVNDSHYKSCSELKSKLYSLICGLGLERQYTYPSFDHPRYYRKNGGDYLITYSPYPSHEVYEVWDMLIKNSAGTGLRIEKIYDQIADEGDGDWFYSPMCDTYLVERTY